MADGPITRNEWVEQQLREAILSGDLEPGERLLTASLAERFSVSPTPLREALHRLTGEGLVDFAPQRGARVAPLSRNACIELRELRTLLDPEAARRALEHADASWTDRVSDASALLHAAWGSKVSSHARSEKAYRDFYDVLLEPCPSDRLRRISRIVRDEEARYRIVALRGMGVSELGAHHDRVLAAAIDARPDDLSEAIVDEVLAYATRFLDGFGDAGAADGT